MPADTVHASGMTKKSLRCGISH